MGRDSVRWVTSVSPPPVSRMGPFPDFSPGRPTGRGLRIKDVHTPQPRSRLAARAGAGLLATGLAVAVGHAVAGLVAPGSSPFLAVADSVVDRAPAAVREATIDALGTADKPALMAGLAVILVITGVAVGLLERPGRPVGTGILALFGLLGTLAAMTRPTADPLWALPTILGAVAAIVALRAMIVALHPADSAGRRTNGAEDPADPATGSQVQRVPDRRRFLVLAGSAVTVIAAAGATGVALTRRAAESAAERTGLRLPRVLARNAAPAVPAGVLPDAPGVTPFLTDNADFYRIDTALRVPSLSTADWRLRIHGMVEREIELDWQSLVDREARERIVTLTCVSNEVGGDLVGTASWTGFPIADLLAEAAPLPGADMLLSTSVDGWTAGTPLETLTDGRDALLAVGMNGEPLPFEHGYPVRQVVPGLYGYVSATKWVVDWEVTRFDRASAYWTDRGWAEEGPIRTASRIDRPAPLAELSPGPVVVAGTAWAQRRGIARVEVRVDNGPWSDARLSEEYSVDTWRMWSWTWDAEPGLHTLHVRATDGTGRVQPEERRTPVPSGATGWHNRTFRVMAA